MKVSGFSVKFREMLVKVLEHKGERVFQSIFGVNISLNGTVSSVNTGSGSYRFGEVL